MPWRIAGWGFLRKIRKKSGDACGVPVMSGFGKFLVGVLGCRSHRKSSIGTAARSGWTVSRMKAAPLPFVFLWRVRAGAELCWQASRIFTTEYFGRILLRPVAGAADMNFTTADTPF